MPIIIKELSHVYSRGTQMEVVALNNVSLTIEDGNKVGIIGRTGSGKTTLVQHINGILRPTSGRLIVDGIDITTNRSAAREVRKKVGLVFQYPEHQLFEETVSQDVAFGPKNLGITEPTLTERVHEALNLVGLTPDIGSRSPFELSGGQMRRVAIAGVLAMRPKVLILDEPTAGLDPRGREDLLSHLDELHTTLGITVILVSHTMADIARLVNRVVVMDEGKIVMDGATGEIFTRVDDLRRVGLSVPPMTDLMHRLCEQGKQVRMDVLTVDEAADEIINMVRGKRCGS